ncbi:hypothetical protein BDW67DRAFT_163819 [Aspergillus spinulosporus]
MLAWLEKSNGNASGSSQIDFARRESQSRPISSPTRLRTGVGCSSTTESSGNASPWDI